MKIQFDLTVEDYLAFQLFHSQNSPAMKQQKAVCRVFVVVAICSVLFLNQRLAVLPLGWPITCVAAIAITVVFLASYEYLLQFSVKRLARRLIEEGSTQGVTGEHELEISEAALIERTTISESQHAWEGLADIQETDRFALIYISSLQAHVIPRERVIQGDYRTFVDAAIARWKTACAPAVSEGRALAIAKEHAEDRQWPWLEPVECKLETGSSPQGIYVIRTNTRGRGCNVVMQVDASDGTITKSNFLPR